MTQRRRRGRRTRPRRGELDATNHFRFNRNGTLAELRKICNHPYLNNVVNQRLDTTDIDLLVRTSGKFELLDVRRRPRRPGGHAQR